DDLDLRVADVALDVVKLSHVRVRNDERFARKLDNVLESFWIDVSQIDEDAKALAFAHDVAAKVRKAVARRAAWLENPAAARGVTPRMRQTNRPQAELVKHAEQIQIVAQRLHAFHGNDQRNLVRCASLLDLGRRFANREPIRLLHLNI